MWQLKSFGRQFWQKGPAGTNVRIGMTLNFVWSGRFRSNQDEPLPFRQSEEFNDSWISSFRLVLKWPTKLPVLKLMNWPDSDNFKRIRTISLLLVWWNQQQWSERHFSGCLFCRSFKMVGIEKTFQSQNVVRTKIDLSRSENLGSFLSMEVHIIDMLLTKYVYIKVRNDMACV